MDVEAAAQSVADRLEGLAVDVALENGHITIRCRPDELPKVMAALKGGEPRFPYFSFMTAVDYPPGPAGDEGLEEPGRCDVVYHVAAALEGVGVFVTTSVPRTGADPVHPARVPSIAGIYPGAQWHERECFDLFGIDFEGHPDLRRILLPDDWVGHPLLKDDDPSVNDLEYTPERRWPEVADQR